MRDPGLSDVTLASITPRSPSGSRGEPGPKQYYSLCLPQAAYKQSLLHWNRVLEQGLSLAQPGVR